ncbi:hypothetical protein OROMI_023744 [Orobanche minor]
MEQVAAAAAAADMSIGGAAGGGKASDHIITTQQNVIMTSKTGKIDLLRRLVDELGEEKTAIIFVKGVDAADNIAKNLGKEVTTVSGCMSPDQRNINLQEFRAKRYNILVATELASRVMKLPEVSHVINYDMPHHIKYYTHRVRRAGNTGIATTFLTLLDTQVFYDLNQMLIKNNIPVPLKLARHYASKIKYGFNSW